MRLVQLSNGGQRRVAIVEEPDLELLSDVASIYEMALGAAATDGSLTSAADGTRSGERVAYDEVYGGASPWKLLAPIDVPGDPQKVLVSGTGLTHLGSARERQAMHAAPQKEENMTDSMRMFEWGREGGRPGAGQIGIAPEWFYKGDGFAIQAPFAPLHIPAFAEDGGEEAEVAAIYIVGERRHPASHRDGRRQRVLRPRV